MDQEWYTSLPCQNTNNGAKDAYGAECGWYDNYPIDCGYYDTEEFIADQMYCSCWARS